MRIAWLLATALVGGCFIEPGRGDDDSFAPRCNPPSGVRYTCAPNTLNARGCAGPRWTTNAGEVRQEDPNLEFAVGCQAQLPECSPYYPSSIRTLTCEQFDSQLAPSWVEPL
ncbi:MAG: hypothetical protein HOV81_24965 [Kofleriaceae bacterium]|nr:hypothetical protein [Kofleriaceae bacterium]